MQITIYQNQYKNNQGSIVGPLQYHDTIEEAMSKARDQQGCTYFRTISIKAEVINDPSTGPEIQKVDHIIAKFLEDSDRLLSVPPKKSLWDKIEDFFLGKKWFEK